MRVRGSICLHIVLAALVAVLAAFSVRASEPAGAGAETLTNATVVTLQQSGLGDSVILQLMKTSRCEFETGIPAILELKASGVGDAVIAGMMQAMQGKSVNGPGNLDLNDPLVPHPSGIYLYTESGGRPKMTPLEPASFIQQKTGGFFLSAITYGGAKVKTKGMLSGEHAVIQSDDPSPTFYFYFDQSGMSLNRSGAAFWGQASSPNEFVLAEAIVKAGMRELTYGQGNSFGTQAGTMTKANREFKLERVADGVYRVTPEPLSSGEYCFYSAAGAGGGSVGRLFDFGVRSAVRSLPQVVGRGRAIDAPPVDSAAVPDADLVTTEVELESARKQRIGR